LHFAHAQCEAANSIGAAREFCVKSGAGVGGRTPRFGDLCHVSILMPGMFRAVSALASAGSTGVCHSSVASRFDVKPAYHSDNSRDKRKDCTNS
jgi:hypothetical protein